MPTRFIKESCRSSKNLDRLSDFEERLFWRLITTADDYGRFLACPELVRSTCFPYRSISVQTINKALLGLQHHHLVTLYRVDDRQYGEFLTFEKHQGKPRSRKSKYPNRLDYFVQADASTCMQIHADVPGHPDTDTDTDLNSSSLKIKNAQDEDFIKFWEAYPRKVGKKDARRAWDKATDKPSCEELLRAIEDQKKSEQWLKDGGQYIPHPSTWLNHGRWADVMQVSLSQADPCKERVFEGKFLVDCKKPSVTVVGGRPLCQAHKEYHERKSSPVTA